MQQQDITALAPALIVTLTSLVLVVQIALYRRHLLSAILCAAGLLAAFISLPGVVGAIPREISILFIVDRFALLMDGIILLTSIGVGVLAFNYLERIDENREEFYAVLLIAVLGAMALVSARHFVSLFLGLETLTVALYVMIAYLRRERPSLEAGIKYLILAAASSAFLLFGMALIYAETGSMIFSQIASILNANPNPRWLYIMFGTAFIVAGAGFKLAVVPFHLWTPDVYEGAPAPATAFIATVSKGGMLALLLRYFVETDGYDYAPVLKVLAAIAILSMFVGNILAIMQKNVKRLLAYSSIAHLGYMLVAFVAGGAVAVEAVVFYLIGYFATTVGAFGIIGLLATEKGEPMALDDYRGLFWRRPWIASVFGLMLLSLAGIPLTAGFVGKFMVVIAGVNSDLWLLLVLLAISSAIGVYYYIRVIAVMFSRDEADQTALTAGISTSGKILLGTLCLVLLYLGILPGAVLDLISSMIGGLV